ncbi:SAM-dependent methyltransferase [Gallibacterium salpingitidis]|uniref:Release factor glutamine methyltransferase n=1 Tax=Gallibacterium salpingitidis TaxID=505341 RepID=A0AB36E0E2_9PAST|nr:peptide chain release factor N(5)-glutamine methyltransferase [Gallibacterium salpingitidis]OBX07682.1 SAM-dependent methyltransferase [Gallibacterium salpingitidis]OBX07882.1 SAM-dependent methyltransferase [Gallibacterium salpingitidis]WKT01021.1 peptide chain release factor N(5)-glutamine methyltransferase [Gallibacterium salpingitidis]
MTYAEWLRYAIAHLQKNGNDSAQIDAQLLLTKVTGRDRSYFLAFGETELTATTLTELESLLQRRSQGEPIAYITGNRGFWSLDLAVSEKTLIPRPDTECLVETALTLIDQQFPPPQPLHILDLGTGTGAIALALADELQQRQRDYQVMGVDRIAEAVALATQNAETNQIKQVSFLQSDWFSALSQQQKFEIIVSNPPYIAKDDPHLQQGDVRFEPLSALVAEDNGLADIAHIIEHGCGFIAQRGWLLLEHGWQQAEAVQTLFAQYHWQDIQTVIDYGGNQRVTFARWSK